MTSVAALVGLGFEERTMAPRRRTGRNAGAAATLAVLLAAQSGLPAARAEGVAAVPGAGPSVPAPPPAVTAIPDAPRPGPDPRKPGTEVKAAELPKSAAAQ
ncbi:hypothetical protein VP06_16785, partial [Methylobacterium aquaticum]